MCIRKAFVVAVAFFAISSEGLAQDSSNIVEPYQPLKLMFSSPLGDSPDKSAFFKNQISIKVGVKGFFKTVLDTDAPWWADIFFGSTSQTITRYGGPDSPFISDFTTTYGIVYRLDFRPKEIGNGLILDLGILEHQDNSTPSPGERSWNRSFFQPSIYFAPVLLEYKWWVRHQEKQRSSPEDPLGDKNPDIEKFLGKGRLTVRIDLDREKNYTLYLMGRKGDGNLTTYQVEFFFAPKANKKEFGFFAQYFEGYGESLSLYNIRRKTFSLGFMVKSLNEP